MVIGNDRQPTAAERLADLPARTLRRPVCNLLQSTRAADEAIGDAIIELAQGPQTDWTHGQALELIDRLEAERRPLEAWRHIAGNH